MNHYEQSKKARRVASVVYLLVMAVILGGTFLSNQQKESTANKAKAAQAAKANGLSVLESP